MFCSWVVHLVPHGGSNLKPLSTGFRFGYEPVWWRATYGLKNLFSEGSGSQIQASISCIQVQTGGSGSGLYRFDILMLISLIILFTISKHLRFKEVQWGSKGSEGSVQKGSSNPRTASHEPAANKNRRFREKPEVSGSVTNRQRSEPPWSRLVARGGICWQILLWNSGL